MNEDQTALPLGSIQSPIPGLEDAGRSPRKKSSSRADQGVQRPLMVEARDELPQWPLRPHTVGDDQLSFGPNQEPLAELEPEAVQLSLLPEPAPWEAPESEPPVSRKGRLAKRRARQKISPGQRSLF